MVKNFVISYSIYVLFDNKTNCVKIKNPLTKESLVRMLNQSINQSINSIIVSFLDFYKKAKDVVSLLKCIFMTSFFYLKIFGLQSLRCK